MRPDDRLTMLNTPNPPETPEALSSCDRSRTACPRSISRSSHKPEDNAQGSEDDKRGRENHGMDTHQKNIDPPRCFNLLDHIPIDFRKTFRSNRHNAEGDYETDSIAFTTKAWRSAATCVPIARSLNSTARQLPHCKRISHKKRETIHHQNLT